MKFEVNIDDTNHLAGITKAREVHNEGKPEAQQIPTDEAYVQFVVASAAASYARVYVEMPQTLPEAQQKIRDLTARETSRAEK